MPTLTSGGSIVVPHGFVGQRVLELVGRLPLHLVGAGTHDHIATPGLERSQGRDPRKTAVPAHPLSAHFLGSLSPSLHREFTDKFKLVLDPSYGVFGSRKCLFKSLATAQKIRSGRPACRGDLRQRSSIATANEVPAGRARRSSSSRRWNDAGAITKILTVPQRRLILTAGYIPATSLIRMKMDTFSSLVGPRNSLSKGE